MIEAITTTCFQRRGIVWLVFVLIALYGTWSWTQLPVEAYPDIADVTSQVVTQVPGLGAEEVEQQITVPLERALMGTPGLHVLRSRSLFALSLITLVFDDGTEGYFARQRVLNAYRRSPCPTARFPGSTHIPRPPARFIATRWNRKHAACASCPICNFGR